MATDSIKALRDALVGRRVLAVQRRVYQDEGRNFSAEYPYLKLDDGSEIILLDEWGRPPLVEVEVPPRNIDRVR